MRRAPSLRDADASLQQFRIHEIWPFCVNRAVPSRACDPHSYDAHRPRKGAG